MATFSKAFFKPGSTSTSNNKVMKFHQESSSMTRSLLKDDGATRNTAKTHRRSQSNDSTDSSSINDYIMKTGKLRRRLQWKPLPAVKDLLVPTSNMTIDGDSVASNGGGTCVTEATAHTATTQSMSQRSLASSKTRSIQKEHEEKPPPPAAAATSESESKENEKPNKLQNHQKQPSKPKKKRSKLVKPIQASALQKVELKFSKSTSDLPLPPRAATLPSSNSNKNIVIPRVSPSLLERRSSDPHPLPLQQTTATTLDNNSSGETSPMTTPATFLFGQSNSKENSPLTPIAPMQLSFEGLMGASPPCSELDESMMVDDDDLDFPSFHGDEAEEEEEDSSNDYSLCSEFGIVLCPFDNLKGVASPLTPSPTLHSPPVRRRSQGPNPFILNNLLTDNHKAENCGEKETEAKESTTPTSASTKKQEDLGTAADDISVPFSHDTTLHLAAEVEIRSADTSVVQKVPKLPDRRTLMLRSKGGSSMGISMRSMVSITRSIPVDLDEGTFVNAKNNLEAIEEMASEHLHHGELDEAVEVYKELLRGQLDQYGHEHLCVGTTLNKLASIHMKQRDYTRAVQASQKAISVRKIALGDQSSDVAVSLVHLGLAKFELQEYDSALMAFQEALSIRREVFGSNHLKVAKVLNNIGCSLKQLSKSSDAIDAFEEALEIQKHALQSVLRNEGDPDSTRAFRQMSLEIASSLSNICTVKISLSLYGGALEALEEALQIQTPILGNSHPEVEETMRGIEFIKNSMKYAPAVITDDHHEPPRSESPYGPCEF